MLTGGHRKILADSASLTLRQTPNKSRIPPEPYSFTLINSPLRAPHNTESARHVPKSTRVH